MVIIKQRGLITAQACVHASCMFTKDTSGTPFSGKIDNMADHISMSPWFEAPTEVC